MKLANNPINAFAKKLFHHSRGNQRAKLMHPKRDWLIGLVMGVIIMLTMISWSAYTYLEKRSAIELSDTNTEVVVPVYNADVVADALDLFAQREQRFAELTNQTTAPIVELEVNADSAATSTAATSTLRGVEPDKQPQIEPEQSTASTPDTLDVPPDNNEDNAIPQLNN